MFKVYYVAIFLSLLIHCLFFYNYRPSSISNANPDIAMLKLKNGEIIVKTRFLDNERKINKREFREINNHKIKMNKEIKLKKISQSEKMISPKITGILHLDSKSSFEIKYPYLSKIHNEQGVVTIQIFINAKGFLEKYKILKASLYPRLNNEVIRVIRSMKYRPAKINGEFVSSSGIKEFVFKLQ